MTSNKWFFLHHWLSATTPLYGGAGAVNISLGSSIDSGDTCNSSHFTMPAHAGTHVDVPFHFLRDGRRLQDYEPSDWRFGKVVLIDIKLDAGEILNGFHFETHGWPSECELLLVRTGFERFRGLHNYSNNGPGVHESLAPALLDRVPGLRMIGFDFISLSSFSKRDQGRAAHRAFLGRDIRILEDMKLSLAPKEIDQVLVSPLPVEGADGAPCFVVGQSFG